MGYDCSVTKRKGCNYCIRSKKIPFTKGLIKDWCINDSYQQLLGYDCDDLVTDTIKINYCPICGKKLTEY